MSAAVPPERALRVACTPALSSSRTHASWPPAQLSNSGKWPFGSSGGSGVALASSSFFTMSACPKPAATVST
eukprot:4680007-Prymnesium_polylepis.1